MHSEQLAEHGGSDGIRDETLLDSALAKPLNVFAYADEPDIFRLAASYAFGIARNHAFIDGNKRTALVVSITFLDQKWLGHRGLKRGHLLHLPASRRGQPRAKMNLPSGSPITLFPYKNASFPDH